MPPHDAWVVGGLLAGRDRADELAKVSPDWSSVATLMASAEPAQRGLIFRAATAMVGGQDFFLAALTNVDMDGPPPVDESELPFTTAADIRKIMSETRWTWPSWIPASRIVGIAAPEGVGKTRLALDLARRSWLGLPWPDNQEMTLLAQTPTLWICSDGHQDEIVDSLTLLGLPDEAIVFPTPPDDPYGGTDLDAAETFERLDRAIAAVRPAFVFIDTLTTATARDLCEQRSVAILKVPLLNLVQRHQVNIVLLLHVSKEGQALGRRIRGITRTLMHLECPDPNHPERLRLWVEKSYAKKPSALGVTIGEKGNEYDTNPPVPVQPNKGGRPPKERDKAIEFVREALQKEDCLATDLCAKWEVAGGKSATFWRAIDAMREGGELASDGGNGTGKQMMLHFQGPEDFIVVEDPNL